MDHSSFILPYIMFFDMFARLFDKQTKRIAYILKLTSWDDVIFLQSLHLLSFQVILNRDNFNPMSGIEMIKQSVAIPQACYQFIINTA